MNMPRLVPEDHRPRPAVYLARAAAALAYKAAKPLRDIDEVAFARSRWGDSVTPLLLTRGSTVPATTSSPTWAGALATTVVGDFLASLAPVSAASRLFSVAPQATFSGAAMISFPRRSAPLDPAAIGWIEEGMPIPILQYALDNAVLGPTKKLAGGCTISRETADFSNAEIVIGTLLRENAALSLDVTLFSALPATAARPAGILAGVAALSPAAAGPDAMLADLNGLADAVGGTTSRLAFVANPKQANNIRLARGGLFPSEFPIWSTIGVAAGNVLAIGYDAFVSGYDATPEVSASKEAMIEQQTTPAADPLTGGPTRSTWQTDCIAVKLILRAAWCMRAAGAVAWVEGTNW